MPRRALSTLRAEIKDVGPSGASMDVSNSSTSFAAVSADPSLELLIRNLRGLAVEVMKFEKKAPFLVVGMGNFRLEMYTVAAVDDTAII